MNDFICKPTPSAVFFQSLILAPFLLLNVDSLDRGLPERTPCPSSLEGSPLRLGGASKALGVLPRRFVFCCRPLAPCFLSALQHAPGLEQSLLPKGHFARIGFGVVLVPQQMQKAVDKVEFGLCLGPNVPLAGPAANHGQGNGNVSEETGNNSGIFNPGINISRGDVP